MGIYNGPQPEAWGTLQAWPLECVCNQHRPRGWTAKAWPIAATLSFQNAPAVQLPSHEAFVSKTKLLLIRLNLRMRCILVGRISWWHFRRLKNPEKSVLSRALTRKEHWRNNRRRILLRYLCPGDEHVVPLAVFRLKAAHQELQQIERPDAHYLNGQQGCQKLIVPSALIEPRINTRAIFRRQGAGCCGREAWCGCVRLFRLQRRQRLLVWLPLVIASVWGCSVNVRPMRWVLRVVNLSEWKAPRVCFVREFHIVLRAQQPCNRLARPHREGSICRMATGGDVGGEDVPRRQRITAA